VFLNPTDPLPPQTIPYFLAIFATPPDKIFLGGFLPLPLVFLCGSIIIANPQT